MTLDRTAARARCEAATKGPWEETWKQIPGLVGYEVSDCGNVRSYYLGGNRKQKRAEYPRLLSLATANGYRSVALPNNAGSYSARRVHRLVMEAFVGPCPEGKEVAHLNGDPSDNRLSNLAYVTHKENEAHKALHGTKGDGQRNSNAVLQGWQVAEIKYLAAKSVPQGKIAALFDIRQEHVNDILHRRIWADEPARTDLPAALDELDAKDAEIERLRGLLREWTDMDPLRYDSEYSACPWCAFDYSNMRHEADCAFVMARGEVRMEGRD